MIEVLIPKYAQTHGLKADVQSKEQAKNKRSDGTD